MGVVPKLESSCFCCSLKTGSFVTAWLLLVGGSVQIGYYAFLVDHMYPQKMCKDFESVFVRIDTPAYPDYDYYGTWREDLLWWKHLHRSPQSDGWPQGQSAANSTDPQQANKSNAANSAGGEPGNSSGAPRHAGDTTDSERAHSSYTANTAAVGEPANSSHAAQHKDNVTAGQQNKSSYTANTAVGEPAKLQHKANVTAGQQNKSSYTADTAVGEPANSQHKAKVTAGQQNNSSYTADTAAVGEPANSSHTAQHKANITAGRQKNSGYKANTTSHTPTNSSHAASNKSTVNNKRHHKKNRPLTWPFRIISSYPQYRVEYREYERPCVRDYKPFDADSGLLDFDLRGPFDKSILYINIGIWVILMVATIPLMAAVYKESACLLCAWLACEAVLLTVATAGAITTAAAMFRAVPVQIGIVTLLNMAIHLGIDIYLMMVVVNYRRSLTTKEENVEDDEQVIV